MKRITMKMNISPENSTKLLFIIFYLLVIFMHSYKLASIPFGIHVDEMGMGYDAWCIANYGVDRYLKSYPIYFINFGGGQSCLYTYICAIFVNIFGLSTITMRMPAVIFALLTLFYGLKIIKLRFNNNKDIILLFLILYTIVPYFTMQSRFGLDANLMLGASTVFLYYFMFSIHHSSTKGFFVSGIIAGMTLYTYAISYIVIPIFLLLSFLYLIWLKLITIKQIAIFTLPLAVLAFPLILVQVVNMYGLAEMKIGLITITKLPAYRYSEISIINVFNNIANVINSIFLYDWLPYNTFKNYLTMYWISLPFILVGVYIVLVHFIHKTIQKEYCIDSIIIFWLISEIFMGCLLGGDGPNTNKLNGAFISVIYILVYGINYVFSVSYKYRKILLSLTVALYFISYISFTNYYFREYRDDIRPQYLFVDMYSEAIQTIKEYPIKTTYIEDDKGNRGDSYIYFLGSNLISPYEFNILENGTNSYKNFIFSLPDEVYLEAYYIVSEVNINYLDKLLNLGFKKIKSGSYYICTRL